MIFMFFKKFHKSKGKICPWTLSICVNGVQDVKVSLILKFISRSYKGETKEIKNYESYFIFIWYHRTLTYIFFSVLLWLSEQLEKGQYYFSRRFLLTSFLFLSKMIKYLTSLKHEKSCIIKCFFRLQLLDLHVSFL